MIEKLEKQINMKDGEFIEDLPQYMKVKGKKRQIEPPTTVGGPS